MFGNLGNMTALFIIRKTPSPRSTKLIISVLAVSDTLNLSFGLASVVGPFIYHTAFPQIFSATCKFSMFVGLFLGAVSFWMVAVLTAERAIAVAVPLKANLIISFHKILVVVLFVCAVFAAGVGIVISDSKLIAMYNPEGLLRFKACFSPKHWESYKMVGAIAGNMMPVAIVFVGNIVIIKCVISNRKQSRNLGRNTNNMAESQLFITTVSVSVTFLLLSTPLVFYYAIGPYIFDSKSFNDPLNPYFLVADCMSYSNFGINFYLYIAFTKSFRGEMQNFLKGIKSRVWNTESSTG